ncbi:MAG: hypothetical protein ACK4UO_18180 [Pseudolabrys sp.]
MNVHAGRTAFAAFVAVIAWTAWGSAPVNAAVPADACKMQAAAARQEIGVAPNSKQPQVNWQREGREITITIPSAGVNPNTQAVVCFRWMLDKDTAEGANEYLDYRLQSPTVALLNPPRAAPAAAPAPAAPAAGVQPRPAPSAERADLPLKFNAIVPPLIQKQAPPPRRDRTSQDRVAGKYGPNNGYPIADVTVLLFESDQGSPAVAYHSPTGIGIVSPDNYCDIPGLITTSGSGVAKLGEHKNWQPVGGQFDFVVTSAKPIPSDALIKICFRWKLTSGDPGRFFDSGGVRLLEPEKDRTLKIAATVPDVPCRPSRFFGSNAVDPACPDPATRSADYAVLGFAVPRADARIIVFDTDDSPLVNIITTVGITHYVFAIFLVVIVMALILFVLCRICRKRLKNISASKSLLCIITTRSGFASLSQFQIVLWTLVVLASVIYVIALSGDLIEITSGTLVLLGISGGATLAAKLKSETDEAKPVTVPDPVAAAQEVAIAQSDVDRLNEKIHYAASPDALQDVNDELVEAKANLDEVKAMAALANAAAAAAKARATLATTPGDAKAQQDVADADKAVADRRRDLATAAAKATKAERIRHPTWTDLVMEEVRGREIDVTRVQMLCFTLVTAVFVGLSVATNYVIPEIPNGYLILMGISNGVYVGSKYATRT